MKKYERWLVLRYSLLNFALHTFLPSDHYGLVNTVNIYVMRNVRESTESIFAVLGDGVILGCWMDDGVVVPWIQQHLEMKEWWFGQTYRHRLQ